MKYRSEIDGLRAIAVLPVVLCHAQVTGFSGGFVGVDIFFVISGFLICSLITDELSLKEFSILHFYERRCRRILPALFVMLAVVFCISAFILLPPDMDSFCRSLIAAILFLSNMFFWKSASYFDGASQFKPLLHTWSLGVEEQFYIFVPLLLFAISKWFKSRYTFFLSCVSIISLLLSVWALSHAPTGNFYSLPTRFWELALGALVATSLADFKISHSTKEIIGILGLGLIIYPILMFSDETPFPGLNALFPCIGAAAIIYSSDDIDSVVGRMLSTGPMVFVGKISYSLYLWHWPLLSLLRYHVSRDLTYFEIAGVLTLSLFFSVFSWKYVETPFRKNTSFFSRRVVFSSSGIAMFVVFIVGALGISSSGFSSRFPDFEEQKISGVERYNSNTCHLLQHQTFDAWRGGECFLTSGHTEKVLLWGDSFAAHYAPGIVDEATRISVDLLQYTAAACPPVFGYYTAASPHCRDFNDNIPKILSKYGIKKVIMSARWESLFKRGVTPNDVANTVKRLNEMGIKVFVIGQSPVFNNDVQRIFAQTGSDINSPVSTAFLSFKPEINDKLRSVLPNGSFVDPLLTFCSDNSCMYRLSSQYVVVDVGHFSSFGSKFAVDSYFPFLSERK